MAKAQYVGVSGVARKAKQPYVGVNGVARKVKNGYVGVNGVARQYFSGGTPLGDLGIGTSVYMNVDGALKEFIVVQQGVPSTAYDTSCDGTWLLMKDIYAEMSWDDMYNSYADSEIHSYLNNTFINLFDSKIRNAIKQVKLPYTKEAATGSFNGSLATGSNGISAKVFLLSFYEVGLTKSDLLSTSIGVREEGAALDYFNGGTNSDRIGYLDGKACTWWLRSPDIKVWDDAFIITVSGKYSLGHSRSIYHEGVRPAIILPYGTMVDSNFNIIA